MRSFFTFALPSAGKTLKSFRPYQIFRCLHVTVFCKINLQLSAGVYIYFSTDRKNAFSFAGSQETFLYLKKDRVYKETEQFCFNSKYKVFGHVDRVLIQ